MEYLTRELTAIEKVRRNVILLAALAFLLAVFPVETDQVAFLGAKFSSEVVAFGLFHGLVFYVGVLFTRTFVYTFIVDSALRQRRGQVLKEEAEIKARAETGDPVARAMNDWGWRNEKLGWRGHQIFRLYVLVGEYLFPIAAGAVAAIVLSMSQEFPMVWELQLRAR